MKFLERKQATILKIHSFKFKTKDFPINKHILIAPILEYNYIKGTSLFTFENASLKDHIHS